MTHSPNEHKSLVQHQFGRSAQDYATSDVHAAGESLSVLLELVDAKDNWRAVDIATGAGHTAILFAPHVQQLVATDITEEMLQTTSALAADTGIENLTSQIADAESLPFDDQSFDLVTCRLAFHHFPNQAKSLSEFARVLKPGGTLGFTDNFTVEDAEAAKFYNRFEVIRDPSHFCVQSLSALSRMFYEAHLEIVDTRLLSKEFEFHQWADRQRVTDHDKTRLLSMLDEVPEALLPLLRPRKTDETAYFSLAEAVIIARKQ